MHLSRRALETTTIQEGVVSEFGDLTFKEPGRDEATSNALDHSMGVRVLPADLNAMALLHEVLHALVSLYEKKHGVILKDALAPQESREVLQQFLNAFPTPAVLVDAEKIKPTLEESALRIAEETLLLYVANENPAYEPARPLITDAQLRAHSPYLVWLKRAGTALDDGPKFGPRGETLLELLLLPAKIAPHSLLAQIDFIRENWGVLLAETGLLAKLHLAHDLLMEESWVFRNAGPGPAAETGPKNFFAHADNEYERFSEDREWMPNVVMIAKSTFVWLAQLEKSYGRRIATLADIPDEELATLSRRGINALWLIGLWKRAKASARIKRMMGNGEALASAYSLDEYDVADELGGFEGWKALRNRCARHGIRLASDMVPNHVGIDAGWVMRHPDWFIQTREPPYANYTYSGADLSEDSRVGVFIEDGYWRKSDAAVTFKRLDRYTNDVRYIYHGNDGTSMPWNDTAQLDYTRADVREAVIQTVIHVARMFPIIRFDAAMTLAKRHYQRLWFPEPGSGGDIPSRARFAMTKDEFNQHMPEEFWRELVDRMAIEAPDTLLLAEAFWMMEGYFVRTLGMHRVYNSAFMNMLKMEENQNFRLMIKNTLEFDPEVLKRFVNFMNNPDEKSAKEQFGDGDKYFGACLLMATLPGLPMFGHGQIEGFTEKYGMEYARPLQDESPNEWLVGRHEREIFPTLKLRHVFSGSRDFRLYDFVTSHGNVSEDVIAYSNRSGGQAALVVFHNKYAETQGTLKESSAFKANKDSGELTRTELAHDLGLHDAPNEAWIIFSDPARHIELLRPAWQVKERGLSLSFGAFTHVCFTDIRVEHSTRRAPLDRVYAEIGDRMTHDVRAHAESIYLRAVHEPFADILRKSFAKRTAFDLAVLAKAVSEALDLPQKEGEIDTAIPSTADFADVADIEGQSEILSTRLATLLEADADEEPLTMLLAAYVVTRATLSIAPPETTAHKKATLLLERPLEGTLAPALGLDLRATVSLVLALAEVKLGANLRATILSACNLSRVRDFLLVHESGGTVWFNKERFEAFSAAIAEIMKLDGIAVKDEEIAAAMADSLRSAFRFDDLVTLFTISPRRTSKRPPPLS